MSRWPVSCPAGPSFVLLNYLMSSGLSHVLLALLGSSLNRVSSLNRAPVSLMPWVDGTLAGLCAPDIVLGPSPSPHRISVQRLDLLEVSGGCWAVPRTG